MMLTIVEWNRRAIRRVSTPRWHVLHHRTNHRPSVDDGGTLSRGVVKPFDFKRIRVLDSRLGRQPLKLHGGLALETDAVADADEGSDGVEQPSGTRRFRSIKTAIEHRFDCLARRRGYPPVER